MYSLLIQIKTWTKDYSDIYDYDSHEDFYELHFCGDRPIEYLNTTGKREIFWELIKYGDSKLNNYNNQEE